jgi:hypothetical protein
VGLVSPRVAARRMQGAGWYTDTVVAERPDWLVVRRGVLAGGHPFAGHGEPFRDFAERDSLLARYSMLPGQEAAAGEQDLVILRRR